MNKSTATTPRLLLALAAACAMALCLLGCSSKPPIEQVVDSVQSSIPDLKAQYADTYSDITITASGSDTIVYTYTYKDAVDAAATATTLDGQKDTLQSTCDEQVFPAMKQAGVTAPKAQYVFLNPDGSQVWTNTFSAS
ncbi:MAG: DUF4854 domain-containing protein [Propionibacteriaceae bacterium]|jgi:outer membrane murein-binding lipoprotein Lpp|nr:DUF4854 domain-containing protein [Propionibacteriaceae bacterium]